jgi:hypothetical protein
MALARSSARGGGGTGLPVVVLGLMVLLLSGLSILRGTLHSLHGKDYHLGQHRFHFPVHGNSTSEGYPVGGNVASVGVAPPVSPPGAHFAFRTGHLL